MRVLRLGSSSLHRESHCLCCASVYKQNSGVLMSLMIKILISLIITATILSVLIILFFTISFDLTFRADKKSFSDNVRKKIPDKIQTVGIIANDFQYVLPGGGCGGVTYKLSQATANLIKAEGLSFFEDVLITDSVEYRGKIDYWREWQKAPSPISSTYIRSGDNRHTKVWIGCMRNLEKFIERNKHKLIIPFKMPQENNYKYYSTEGYYTYVTGRGHTVVWVIPEWKILIYYYDVP